MAICLSVNVNKIATLRNSRGGNNPDLVRTTLEIERFGADGITVHPRPDERHIRYEDVRRLKPLLRTEFNIEGNPKEPAFIDLVLEVLPAQVTLVPDATDQLTSNHGWDTRREAAYLKSVIPLFREKGIRVSIFVDPDPEMVSGAKACGADRIELYTEAYARGYVSDKIAALRPYIAAAAAATAAGLGVNAGHDLDLNNLAYLAEQLPGLREVSIGHALVCDALIFGMHNTVQLYKRQLLLKTAGN